MLGAGAATDGAGSNFGTGIGSFSSVSSGLGSCFLTTAGFLIGSGGFTTGFGFMGSFTAGGAGGGSCAAGLDLDNMTTSMTTGGFLSSVLGALNKNNANVRCNAITVVNSKPAIRRDFFCSFNAFELE
jgi:hypothetical protein